jgi:hypothetical protein
MPVSTIFRNTKYKGMLKTYSNQHLIRTKNSTASYYPKKQAHILYIFNEGCILSEQPTTFKISELDP